VGADGLASIRSMTDSRVPAAYYNSRMRVMLASLVLLLSATFAYAEEAAVAEEVTGATYANSDYDFTLWVPGGGTLADASTDPEWDYDETTVFTWVADDVLAQPVFLVMGSALALESEATDQDIQSFVEGLTDEQNNAENRTTVVEVSDVFQVGNRGWVGVLFHDESGETPGEFEIFVTRQGIFIYAVAFHYTDGAENGAGIAEQVLTSFVSTPTNHEGDLSGFGNKATNIFRLKAGLVRVTYSHNGKSNFGVWLLDDNGTKVELIANEIGVVKGSHAFGIEVEGNYLFDVTADGHWAITIQ
jgi:hypothetical protein